MAKIAVKNPIVEIDGDEMARVLWRSIKDRLIFPYLNLELEYFDLSIQNRELTSDEVTLNAAQAVKSRGVGVKCATITPDEARVKEFGLKYMWKSPNGTLRNFIGGVIFREPIVCRNVPRLVSSWKLPVIVARHAFGDQYQALEMPVPGKGRLSLAWRSHDGATVQELAVYDFDSAGVALAMFNLDSSIQAFARACFNYALQRELPLFLSTKNTILKVYDGRFKNIFAEVFEREFKDAFQAAGLNYEHRLIDDMVAYALKSEGGYVWACKNYDGDVMSDAVAQGYGSLGLMTSVLISEDGKVLLSEAAHGTVTRHYRLHRQGQPTSTNPIASIFAWTKALFQRGKMDDNEELVAFARSLEKACVDTVESGCMTKDLAMCIHNDALQSSHYVHTDDFIQEVSRRLSQ